MKNMSPEDMKRQLEAVSSQSSGQQQYYYNVRRERGDGCFSPFRALTSAPCGFSRAGVRVAEGTGQRLGQVRLRARAAPQAGLGARRVGGDWPLCVR